MEAGASFLRSADFQSAFRVIPNRGYRQAQSRLKIGAPPGTGKLSALTCPNHVVKLLPVCHECFAF